ncbi:hypothetical protein ACLOJK_018198 [Asimina triloba]
MGSLSVLQDLRLQYPLARRDESVVDNYHGVPVSDPYRWYHCNSTAFFSSGFGRRLTLDNVVVEFIKKVDKLGRYLNSKEKLSLLELQVSFLLPLKTGLQKLLEEPDADEVKDFVDKQANLTEALLQSCDTREKLKHHILKLYDHPRFDTPFKHGNKYFYTHNTGIQAQSVLYVQDNLEGKPEVLLDPNTLSDDGTVALSVTSVSEDAKFLAYGVSASGSDWITIKVMRIDDKHTVPDSLSWVSFAI